MKIKLLKLLDKILKMFAFVGLFSFKTSTNAQTVYQCLPCPEGQTTSAAGATSSSSCVPVGQATGDFVKTCTNANCTGTLTRGWYRITLNTANGSAGAGVAAVGNSKSCCHTYNNTCMAYSEVAGCVARNGGAGGKGLTKSYVIYLSETASYSYTYNSGAPKIVISNSKDGTRTFQLSAAGNGTNASRSSKSVSNSSTYPACTKTTWTSAAGTNGAASTVRIESGLVGRDASSSAIDGTTSGTGVKITKLS